VPPKPPPPFVVDRDVSPPPLAPPIGTDAFSRLVFHPLDETTAAILETNAEASGWLAVMTDILESQRGFPDTTLLEGAWLQSAPCTDKSRVTINQLNETAADDCVYVAETEARELFYRNDRCKRVAMETGDRLLPPGWRAACLVLLVEPASQRELMEQMFAGGRVITDPVRVNVTYVTTTAAAPNYEVASVNTALSLLLQDAYAADATGQEESGALAAAELALSEKRAQADLYARTVKGLPVYGAGAPSAGQMAEFEARLEELELEQADLQTKLDLLREAAGGECAPSETTTCGRTPQAAPDPWTAADGTRCAGYATKEAYPGAFCGRWASPVRVHS
jgi:hypothetical protein